jgi:hypothetical protein
MMMILVVVENDDDDCQFSMNIFPDDHHLHVLIEYEEFVFVH